MITISVKMYSVKVYNCIETTKYFSKISTQKTYFTVETVTFDSK